MTIRISTLARALSFSFALVAASAPALAADDPAALVQKLSQQFSDASATGDAAVFARELDDDVTFIDESGTVSTKKDIVDGAGPLPSGLSQTLVQSDFHVRFYGSTAVTSFTDTSTVLFHGQSLVAKFRSTEVWLDEKDGWKMISSQTIALPDDPPAVTLSANDLDQYVGAYTAGPGYVFSIARNGSGITGSINGGKPFPLEAEVRDVLFVPGQPRLRRIAERDATGVVTGFVSRREGHDIVLRRVTA